MCQKADIYAVGIMGLMCLSTKQELPFGPSKVQAQQVKAHQVQAQQAQQAQEQAQQAQQAPQAQEQAQQEQAQQVQQAQQAQQAQQEQPQQVQQAQQEQSLQEQAAERTQQQFIEQVEAARSCVARKQQTWVSSALIVCSTCTSHAVCGGIQAQVEDAEAVHATLRRDLVM